MEQLKLAQRAAKLLRCIGLLALAILSTSALTFVAFSGANSAADGSDSEVDSYLDVNATSTNQYAQHPDNTFTNNLTTGTWEGWIFPTSSAARQAFFSKDYNYVLGIDGGRLWTTFSRSWVYRKKNGSLL